MDLEQRNKLEELTGETIPKGLKLIIQWEPSGEPLDLKRIPKTEVQEEITILLKEAVLKAKARAQMKYESYNRGFRVGASARTITSQVGTLPPEDMGAFEQGHYDGYHAFQQAMEVAAKRYGAM